jgi:DNA-binding NarL/FixJ family response regulator
MDTPCKIVVVDDHTMLRTGLRQTLAQQPGFLLVGEAATGTAALRLVRETTPDIVLLDIHLPGMNGIEISKKILADFPATKIIIFSSDAARTLVDEALEIGVCGYVSKTSSVEELVGAISSVMAGKLFLSPDVSGDILSDYRKSLSGEAVRGEPLLSDREKQLLRLIAEGRRNKEISSDLNLGIKSIEAYRSRLMKKLKCASSAELVRYAIREGIAKL